MKGLGAAILGSQQTYKSIANAAAGGKSYVNLLVNGNFEIGELTAPMGWTALGGTTFLEEASIVKFGSKSLKVTATSTWDGVEQSVSNYADYAGRQVTFGAWVYVPSTNTNNEVALMINDNTTVTYTSCPKAMGDRWAWYTVTKLISSAPAMLQVALYASKANYTNEVAYIDGAILVEGDSCPAFVPRGGSDPAIIHHSAADTLTKYENGSVHTNLGAFGTIAIQLPQSPPTGTYFDFDVMTANEFRIDPGAAGGIYINGAKQADDKCIISSDIGASVRVTADGLGDWVASKPTGKWSVEDGNSGAWLYSLTSQTLARGSFTDNFDTTGYIDFNTGTLPAGAVPLGMKAVVTTGFTGNTSAIIQVGIAGDLDRFSSVTDQSVFAASTVVGTGVPADACDGIGAAQTPRVTVTSGTDFTNVSAGSMIVTVYYIKT